MHTIDGYIYYTHTHTHIHTNTHTHTHTHTLPLRPLQRSEQANLREAEGFCFPRERVSGQIREANTPETGREPAAPVTTLIKAES